MTLPDHLLELLACPACHQALSPVTRADGDSALRCDACTVDYPIIDGMARLHRPDALVAETASS